MGRSERVEGAFDATLAEFLYRYWFRAEVEGIENVPFTGGALLVSKHSGAGSLTRTQITELQRLLGALAPAPGSTPPKPRPRQEPNAT